jgi:tetraacyldisaccharide 4'-kinase
LDELKAAVRAVAPAVPIWITDFVPSAVVQVGGSAAMEPSALKGERVLAVSGIGNPESFRQLLAAAGATVADHCVFPDHHAYSRDDLGRILRSAEQAGVDRIVITEKDAVKLAQLDEVKNRKVEMWAVRIELQWLEGFDEWTRVVLQS